MRRKREKSEVNVVAPSYYKKFVEDLAYRILKIVGRERAEIGVYLTDDRNIRELNKKYRGKDRATDVLSFPINEYVENRWIGGDIVISIETARKQAREFGHDTKEEIKRLIVHGFVHLLGYDHEMGEREEKEFFKMEKTILQRLNRL